MIAKIEIKTDEEQQLFKTMNNCIQTGFSAVGKAMKKRCQAGRLANSEEMMTSIHLPDSDTWKNQTKNQRIKLTKPIKI